jgi:hypothetical protein
VTHSRFRVVLALSFAAAACAVDEGDPDDTLDDRSANDISPGLPFATYYIVTHIDQRDCAWPMCGGVFVKEVNKKLTQCADGSYANECHVAETDFSALGLSPALEAKLDEAWQNGGALLRGDLFQDFQPYLPPIDTLAASEGWVGVTGNKPVGVFERLDDSGIVCVTYPCPSFVERILNDGFTRLIAEVDLGSSGATQDQVDAGFAELFATGILAVGSETTITGPAGTMPGFAANEFYTRIDGDYVGEPCGDAICGGGTVCCSAECGLCVEEGQLCSVWCPPPEK